MRPLKAILVISCHYIQMGSFNTINMELVGSPCTWLSYPAVFGQFFLWFSYLWGWSVEEQWNCKRAKRQNKKYQLYTLRLEIKQKATFLLLQTSSNLWIFDFETTLRVIFIGSSLSVKSCLLPHSHFIASLGLLLFSNQFSNRNFYCPIV